MAKKKAAADVNKSAAIREALSANPRKMPMEIAALLAEQGVRVTPAYVSTVKFSLHGAKKKSKRVRVIRRMPAAGLVRWPRPSSSSGRPAAWRPRRPR